ncbi:uncharacterized protein B0H18DRAFT_1132336 [Fomitopsis serialis]|uniref:uncharacterized protein n=1 Tax=Fomitopsis serialis TaxID=139415 RepID=UPI002007B2EE|nr:uncharacterized protein B0H18DRAFT_1132336 [Neoantrodia serialis]KAH9903895.1 hypothetical protein B0H18DRAFT_1132336 [Neoantrodia serialis]
MTVEQGTRVATPPPPSASSAHHHPRLHHPRPRFLTTTQRLELIWHYVNAEVDQLDDRIDERFEELEHALCALKRQQNDINVVNLATQAQAADNAIHMRELHDLSNDIDNAETFMHDDVRKNHERIAKLENEITELKATVQALLRRGDDV